MGFELALWKREGSPKRLDGVGGCFWLEITNSLRGEIWCACKLATVCDDDALPSCSHRPSAGDSVHVTMLLNLRLPVGGSIPWLMLQKLRFRM